MLEAASEELGALSGLVPIRACVLLLVVGILGGLLALHKKGVPQRGSCWVGRPL